MIVFVDTSAYLALLDEDDSNHRRAVEWLAGPGRDPEVLLLTHSYVVVESAALVHRRLGAGAVRVLFDAHLPAASVFYVDEHLHTMAAAAYMASLRRRSSFVDWVSIQYMRARRVQHAFAFDQDFADQGFHLVA